MDLVMVIIRTVFFYVFVLIIFRLMGKREIGELSIQDLVVSLLIAELVAISIENDKEYTKIYNGEEFADNSEINILFLLNAYANV